MACVVVLSLSATASAQAAQPADDAAPLYLRAMKLVVDHYDLNIMSPAASNMSYPPYPPF